MALPQVLLSLLYLHHALAQGEFFPTGDSQFGSFRLTAERSGPPANAEFTPIKVIAVPSNPRPLSARPSRPLLGRPPPPPPLKPQPTRRPRPTRPVAPQPLPIPVPSNQGIPQRPQVPGSVPERPQGVSLIKPMIEIRPDLETVPPTLPLPSTTTPRTADALPAYYQRFIQNEDGSYYFDYSAPNSVQRLEQGFFKHDDLLDVPIMVKTGAYSYISPEGVPFRVDYVADERGYRAFNDNTGSG